MNTPLPAIPPLVIVDVGCGTGELLTLPLASDLGRTVKVYAYEPETTTFRHLRNRVEEARMENVVPIQDTASLDPMSCDVLIVSKVIEHVEDPIQFLADAKRLLKPHGKMIFTTPNGFGGFEIETLLFNTLDMLGIVSLLRKIREHVFRRPGHAAHQLDSDTLATSPHINFFSLADLYQILQGAGLSLHTIEGRLLTAGPFSDRIIGRSRRLIALSTYLALKLPLSWIGAWMLVAENGQAPTPQVTYSELMRKANPFKRLYSRYKRWLNTSLAARPR